MSFTPIGIDLGTTNTVVCGKDGPMAVAVVDNVPQLYLPSAVAFPPSGPVLVGEPARRRRSIDAKNTILSSKRLIGRERGSVAVAEFRDRYPHELGELDDAPAFVTRRGPISPTKIAAMVLEAALLGAGLEPAEVHAIVTVPAGFSALQRTATAAAARSAGIGQAIILDEPIATAVAHGGISGAQLSAVYDIGGGTFDFAVVERTEKRARILAHGGDLFLGGDDLDHALARSVAKTVLETRQWDIANDVEALDRLVAECERAKIRLSSVEQTWVDLAAVEPDLPFADPRLLLTRGDLVRICLDLVRRTFVTCDEVLHEAGVSARQLDGIYLAGGTTSIPFLRDMVAAYFGRPPEQKLSPMNVVAVGAYVGAEAAFAPWFGS
ncbi:MAG: Hsp70 family protein [Deltaproteobacteria bacterium]|nr:Hsp70 family protein [Deltaproteobacteria bacterium]